MIDDEIVIQYTSNLLYLQENLKIKNLEIIMTKKKSPPNFPDILGEITGNQRINIGLVQVALAIRPRVLRAGRPFEVVLLVQNSSDIAVDFVARVRLPDRDAKGKKGRFVNKVDKLVIGLEPAQVGYLILPVSSLPDTAVSADYSLTIDVKMKPASDDKPRRVRTESGGGIVDHHYLADGVEDTIEELKHLNWTANKVSGLRSTGLEVKFGLMSGTVGKITNLEPGWESLWTLSDLSDVTLLLEKFRKQLLEEVLPTLTAERIYPRAYTTTLTNFEQAGFRLSKWEAIVIAKMMTLILVFSDPSKLMELIAGHYNLKPLLSDGADIDTMQIPRWVSQFVTLVNREPHALEQPIKGILNFCYEGLLYDAVTNAFIRVESILGESLGSAKERKMYRNQVISKYHDQNLDFPSVYLPLVLGGISATDLVVLEGDSMEDAVHELRDMVDNRRREQLNDDTAALFAMTDRLMEKVLLKYGYDAKRM